DLTYYECRNLNDEIDKLMREKRHWENQIIALGGANYRRNVAMLDDDGKEVPGTRGYMYFGRAKDLAGVRELFEGRKKEEEEENQALAYYMKFMNQGPSYFGDLDKADGRVLELERQAEDEKIERKPQLASRHPTPPHLCPSQAITASMDYMTINAPNQAKRKIPDEDEAMPPAPEGEAEAPSKSKSKAKAKPKSKSKKSKTEAPAEEVAAAAAATPVATTDTDAKEDADPQVIHARAAAAYIPFLTPADLLPPVLPTREEMEGVLFGLRKRALVEEYFGEGEETAL
ncbi:Isy1-domain-containing protein, partial [Athelia psychrophila]